MAIHMYLRLFQIHTNAYLFHIPHIGTLLLVKWEYEAFAPHDANVAFAFDIFADVEHLFSD